MSRFLDEPREDHRAAVKDILRYLAGTKNWGLWFGRKKEKEAMLVGFGDSDFAGDVDAHKSTIGVGTAQSPGNLRNKRWWRSRAARQNTMQRRMQLVKLCG